MRRPIAALGALACAGMLAACVASPTGTGATSPAPGSASASTPASEAPGSAAPTGPAVTAPRTDSGASSFPSSTGSPGPTTSASPTPSTSPTPKPSEDPKPEETTERPTVVVPPPDNRPAVPMPANPVGMSPLNGLPIGSYRPVLVMKLDNTPNAQPHAGLIDADVVYVEEVEYGITRLAAVFSSRVPKRIGPIRSARITDIDLFAQYGRPAFGYSGAQRKMFPYLRAASIYDVSPYTGGTGYSRDSSRRAPYNLYFDGRSGVSRAPKATKARDMGFVFDETAPAGGLNATSATMAWGYASAGFAYDKKDREYRISLNGQPARAEEWSGGQRAATVVIQYVKQRKSQFWDKGGGNTPHAETIGSGTAMVLRDGRVWKTTWNRPNANSGTTFTLKDGSLMTFKPGQLWIVLLDKKRTATIKPLTKPKVPTAATPRPTATPTPASPTEPSPAVPSPSGGANPTPVPSTGAQ